MVLPAALEARLLHKPSPGAPCPGVHTMRAPCKAVPCVSSSSPGQSSGGGGGGGASNGRGRCDCGGGGGAGSSSPAATMATGRRPAAQSSASLSNASRDGGTRMLFQPREPKSTASSSNLRPLLDLSPRNTGRKTDIKQSKNHQIEIYNRTRTKSRSRII